MNRIEAEQLLDAWCPAHQQEMVNELLEWVSFPSVSRKDLGDESKKAPYGPDVRKMLDHALARAKEEGFRTVDADGYCGFAYYGDAEEELGFISHLDVVPEGQGWIYSPYQPVVKGDFIIGRGCNDNKCSAVLGLYLMKFFRENGIHLDRTFRLMLGTAEETGMEDFRIYQERGGKVPSLSIVADCGFPVVYAEKGGWNADLEIPAGEDILEISAGNVRNSIPDRAEMKMKLREGMDPEACFDGLPGIGWSAENGVLTVTARGRAGHAAFPAGADNALIKLCRAAGERLSGICDVNALSFIAETFGESDGSGMGFKCSDEETGELTSNAGVISLKNGKITLLLDVRYPVSCDIEARTEQFREKIAEQGVVITHLDIELPFYIPKDDPKVQIMQSVYRDVTGDDRPAFAMGGGTYSRAIPNAITFGPGLPGHDQDFLPAGHGGAHGPDEVQSISAMMEAFRIYALSIMKLCGVL